MNILFNVIDRFGSGPRYTLYFLLWVRSLNFRSRPLTHRSKMMVNSKYYFWHPFHFYMCNSLYDVCVTVLSRWNRYWQARLHYCTVISSLWIWIPAGHCLYRRIVNAHCNCFDFLSFMKPLYFIGMHCVIVHLPKNFIISNIGFSHSQPTLFNPREKKRGTRKLIINYLLVMRLSYLRKL